MLKESIEASKAAEVWKEFDIQEETGTPTGIDLTSFPSGEGRGEASKLLINGRMYILNGDRIYDATGRVVK